jgi:hypothetical protein
MYLARKHINGKIHYCIRESYRDKGCFKSRELIDLGVDPTRYIVYPGGASFYIHGDIDDQLLSLGVHADNESLERIFFPFLNSRTRRVIEGFSHKSKGDTHSKAIRDQNIRCETERFHMFDRRRMHYLRFGELDQSKILREPKKLYRQLLDKSRDEIEQLFTEMESGLRPTEKKTYTYVIFDVAGHFPGVFSRKFPHALPQDKVDAFFLEEVCRINDDEKFWVGFERSDRLDDYLVKYLCWFFDNDFEEVPLMQSLFMEWADKHRTFRPPPGPSMSKDEALSVMGIAKQDLPSMTIRSLTAQYRNMAKIIHPDKGGDHEKFIKLNHAYSDLLRALKQKEGGTGYATRYA